MSSKTVNITIEENATFSRLLTITTSTAVKVGVNPVTKEDIFQEKDVPMDLTGFTFEAIIKKSFESAGIIAKFDTPVLDSAGGMMYLSLDSTITSILDENVDWSTATFCTPTTRIGFLGYYDVLATKNGKTTRLFQGKAYVSRGVSGDKSNIETDTKSIARSGITQLSDSIDLPVSSTFMHNNARVEYYNGTIATTPTAGTVTIFVADSSSADYPSNPIGILNASTPATEVSWHTNTAKVKAVASGVVGADGYRLVVEANKNRGI